MAALGTEKADQTKLPRWVSDSDVTFVTLTVSHAFRPLLPRDNLKRKSATMGLFKLKNYIAWVYKLCSKPQKFYAIFFSSGLKNTQHG
jgi:hypothetical protein